MARLARVVVPNIPHHVVQRGTRNQNVFFSGEDKEYYLRLLHKHTKEAGLCLWAYCLMDNHVHLIVVPEKEDSLAVGLGRTHKEYTRMINFRQGWRGYLWQGRFSSFPLDEKYLYAAVRYVERNPVRAGLVRRAEDYAFSSANAHVHRRTNPLVSDNFMVNEIKDWAGYLDNGDTEQDKNLFAKHSSIGRPLGDNNFISKLEKITGRCLRKSKPGPKVKN